MGIIGGEIASEVCQTFKLGSGLSSSSSSSSSSDSCNSIHRSGESKDINIDENDLNDTIKMIWRIEIPAVKNTSDSETLNFFGQLLTGSKFVHDGLLIVTNSGKYYIWQKYPIQFKKCSSYGDAIDEIKSYWKINNNAIHNEYGQTIYDNITINTIKNIIDELPNYYDLFTYNCRHFCSRILRKIDIFGI